ncbi:hypothetical protein LEN26_021315 [Aphanomyces euteiches]|nr:hypothetical protein LEN26_021315 [Aphanomyces euteiches]KAH9122661.1 hypothetical protein AeMF1_006131 [Aphanomyces euteiches]
MKRSLVYIYTPKDVEQGESRDGTGPLSTPSKQERIVKLKSLGTSSERDRLVKALKTNSSMDMYQLGPVIGNGRFGKVRKATHRLSREAVAMKIYNKAQAKTDDQIPRIQKEIDIMKEIDHPNIVRLYEILETNDYIVIAMELCEGEDMAKYIARRSRLKEDVARRIFQQIVDAISYIHRKSIVHRDIKPENIYILDHPTSPTVKILDFGLGSTESTLSAFCGTPAFMAPEIIFQEAYDGKPVDAWSLGVLLYLMTVGKIPFDAKSTQSLYQKILAGEFALPTTLSLELQDLIRQVLVVDSTERLGVDQIKHHPWLGLENQSSLSEIPPSLFVADELLHNAILAEMDGYDVDRLKLHDELASKTYNASTTWYRLVHLRHIKTRKQSSRPCTNTALSSVDFSRFLQERIMKAKTLA